MIVAGILQPLEDVLAEVLTWLHTSMGFSWAWSIVALTVIVRTILLPLTVRQIHSMQSLQRHAPEMKAIQQKWKHDRQRQQQELMKFYKENRINPAASCLPLVAQLPVFLALYFVLRDAENEIFKNFPEADLGWLDIVPSIAADASSHWSGFLLIAIYAISQTTSTLLMSTTMDRMQRTLLLILPLVFLFVIVNFPAGLVLYWVTTNLWTTGQGLITRRLVPKPTPPPKRSSRAPSKEEAAPAKPAPDARGASAPAAPPTTPRRVKRKKKKARR